MSPDVQAAIIGGIAGGVVGGVFSVLGVVLGLFGQRWVRSRGEVLCTIDWRAVRSGVNVSRSDGVDVYERRLQITFLNRKDLPVTVSEMRVVFYRGGKPLGERETPHVEFVNASDQTTPVGPVDLTPGVSVTRTLSVAPGTPTTPGLPVTSPDPNKLRAVQETDRVVFMATMIGTRDKSEDLAPWQDLTPWQ
jgi:hypothetical protein